MGKIDTTDPIELVITATFTVPTYVLHDHDGSLTIEPMERCDECDEWYPPDQMALFEDGPNKETLCRGCFDAWAEQ